MTSIAIPTTVKVSMTDISICTTTRSLQLQELHRQQPPAP